MGKKMITFHNLKSPVFELLAYQVISHAVTLFAIPEDVEIKVIGYDYSVMEKTMGYTDNVSSTEQHIFVSNSELKNMTDEEFVRLIGHEVTHVYQFVTKQLKYLGSNTYSYKGKCYRDALPREYWLNPWEIEARGMEEYFWWEIIRG